MGSLHFGKHKGKDIDEIPSDYLRWLVLQDWFEKDHPDLLKESETELEYRDTWRRHFYEER